MRTPCAKKPGLLGKWRALGRKRPCCKMLLMLPTRPMWLALMWASSGEVEVARVAGGGKRRCAFLRQRGNGNAVEVEHVTAAGGLVPFDVSELAVIANVLVGEAAVKQKASDIGVLGFVGCVELVGVIIHPYLQLLLWGFLEKIWWGSPGVEDPANSWNGRVSGL